MFNLFPPSGTCLLSGRGQISSFIAAASRIIAIPVFCLCLAALAGCSLPCAPGPSGAAQVSGVAISRTALDAVGTRYAYGGSNPASGFDCSGLVLWSYAKHGVSVPRTAAAQSSIGCPVGRGGLKPGDLVVFRIKGDLHTGIYTGRGRFVHSPKRGSNVREDDLNTGYWQDCFFAGRRHGSVY